MFYGRTTLSKFIIEEQRRLEGGAELIALVNDIQTACKYIASAVARGALTGARSLRRRDQCAGRGAEAARRHRQRHHALQLRMGRLSRRHGVRGDARTLRHSGAVSARPLPARVRSARRLVEPRRQRDRRHDLLRAARARRRHRSEARGFPAAGNAAGLRRLRAVRADGDDRHHARHRRARLHARPGDRRVHPHAPEPRDRGGDAGVRGQRVEPALLGAAGQALRRGVHRRQERRARQGFQHALDRVARRRSAPDPDARRSLHVSEGHEGSGASRDGCGCSTRRTRWRC